MRMITTMSITVFICYSVLVCVCLHACVCVYTFKNCCTEVVKYMYCLHWSTYSCSEVVTCLCSAVPYSIQYLKYQTHWVTINFTQHSQVWANQEKVCGSLLVHSAWRMQLDPVVKEASTWFLTIGQESLQWLAELILFAKYLKTHVPYSRLSCHCNNNNNNNNYDNNNNNSNNYDNNNNNNNNYDNNNHNNNNNEILIKCEALHNSSVCWTGKQKI